MKMYNFSENTIKFFKPYLSNRTQIVKDGEFESSSRTVLVPQGSILGPIIILIYINVIHMKLTKSSSLDMYADDSTLNSSGLKDNEIENALQENIDSWKMVQNEYYEIKSKQLWGMLIETSKKNKTTVIFEHLYQWNYTWECWRS